MAGAGRLYFDGVWGLGNSMAVGHLRDARTRALIFVAGLTVSLSFFARGPLRLRFWGLVIGAGLLLPIVLAISVLSSKAERDFTAILVAVLALAGVWFFEDAWVKAGQAVPLS